jgi:hypothetical protein
MEISIQLQGFEKRRTNDEKAILIKVHPIVPNVRCLEIMLNNEVSSKVLCNGGSGT